MQNEREELFLTFKIYNLTFNFPFVSPTPHAVRYYYQLNYTLMKSKKRSRRSRWYVRHDRHSVSLLTNHTVFCTKYRMPLLTPEIAKRCEQIIRKLALDLNVKIIRMAVNLEHVHIFYVYPPKLSPSIIAKKFKNYTSLNLR